MKIRKLPLLLLALACPARGAVGLYLSSPASPVTVPAGGSFAADVTLVETFDQAPRVIGVDFTLAGVPATLSGRDVTGSPMADQISTDAQAFAGHDLGSLVDDLASPLEAGTWHLGTYTMTVPASAVPGRYELTFAAPSYATADFTDHDVNVIGALPVTIAAAPEPAAGAVVVLVLAFAARRAR